MTDRQIEIDLRAWRQFVAVAEELHFGRAAQRLHMTQPPLTQAIAQLERQLGVRLFDRTRRRVQLTTSAEVLLDEVRDVLARARRLPERARSAAAGELGRLRLAFVSTAGFELLPRWVRLLRVHAPRLALDLLEATSDVQLRALENREIDAGVVLHAPGFAPLGCAALAVQREPLVLALPERHPLALAPRCTALDAMAEPLVMFPRRILPSIHDALFALYHAAGRAPQVAQEAIQMQTIVNLVAAGVGLAWVPQSVTRFRREGVAYRKVTSGRRAAAMPSCETSVVWHAEHMAPALERFVELVRTQLPAR